MRPEVCEPYGPVHSFKLVLDIPVGEEFGGEGYKLASLPVHQRRLQAAQVTN